MLSDKIITSISRITGASSDQMLKMDIYHEIDHVQNHNGRKLVFSTKRDVRRLGRGNPLIARRKMRSIEKVDERMKKIRWK